MGKMAMIAVCSKFAVIRPLTAQRPSVSKVVNKVYQLLLTGAGIFSIFFKTFLLSRISYTIICNQKIVTNQQFYRSH